MFARRLGIALVGAAALLSAACVVTPLDPTLPPGSLGANRNAQANGGNSINLDALSAMPNSTSKADDKITFTVVASSANGQPLQYNWSATKGTLSANSGQIVYWSPTKSDGTLESPGAAQISVIITNAAGGSKVGTANVTILASGGANVTGTGGTAAVATPTPAPSATATPAPSPTPAATSTPTASPTVDANASGTADTDDTATDTEDAEADDDATDTADDDATDEAE